MKSSRPAVATQQVSPGHKPATVSPGVREPAHAAGKINRERSQPSSIAFWPANRERKFNLLRCLSLRLKWKREVCMQDRQGGRLKAADKATAESPSPNRETLSRQAGRLSLPATVARWLTLSAKTMCAGPFRRAKRSLSMHEPSLRRQPAIWLNPVRCLQKCSQLSVVRSQWSVVRGPWSVVSSYWRSPVSRTKDQPRQRTTDNGQRTTDPDNGQLTTDNDNH